MTRGVHVETGRLSTRFAWGPRGLGLHAWIGAKSAAHRLLLAKQMFPGRTQYLLDSFHDATKKPFSYLLIDCHPQTPENIRLRTSIFPGERHSIYAEVKTCTPSFGKEH